MVDTPMHAVRVGRGEDRFGERHGLGSGGLAYKVTTEDSRGALLVVELTHPVPGGPARHLHHAQDEWFYVVEGEYVAEVGAERFRLAQGDSLFAPRGVPHVWTRLGTQPGRLVITLTPAGRLETYFRELDKPSGKAPFDPDYLRAYGMELVGPPLALE
jgi:mannose-6-phosphate isomerase-like protein (cupin superfamily)